MIASETDKDTLYYGLPAINIQRNKYLLYSPYCKEFIILKSDQLKKTRIQEELKRRGFFKTSVNKPLDKYKNSHILVFVVTKRCNLQCTYCFSNSTFHDNNNMSPEIATGILEVMSKQHNLSMIHFIGGEPTLNFSVIKKVKERADKLGLYIDFYITTNGTASDSMLEWLINNKFIFKVSWDGIGGQELRPFYGGESSKNKVEKTIIYLIKRNAYFCVRITATKANLPHLVESVQWLIEQGVKFIHIEPISPDGRGVTVLNEIPTIEEFINTFYQIVALAEEKGVWIINSALGNLFNPKGYFCCSPRDRVHHFNPDGSISLCYKVEGRDDPLSQEFIVGNYHVNANCIKIQHNNGIVNNLLALDSSYYPMCNNCFLKYLCSGGCPYRNLKTGTKEPNSWMCQMRKGILRKAIIHLYNRALEDKGSCLEGTVKFYTNNPNRRNLCYF